MDVGSAVSLGVGAAVGVGVSVGGTGVSVAVGVALAASSSVDVGVGVGWDCVHAANNTTPEATVTSQSNAFLMVLIIAPV